MEENYIQREERKKKKLDAFMKSSAEIIGPVTATSIGFLFLGPLGTYVGAATSGPITSILKKIGSEVSDKIMAPREKARVSATYVRAAQMIKLKLEGGEIPRNDAFFEMKENDRSSAETILEGILQKAKNEHEEKKLEYYSAFLSNITFNNKIKFEEAITLLKIIDRLSYLQLTIIAHIKDVKQLELENWSTWFGKKVEAQEFLDFHYELGELFDLNLIKQFNGRQLGGFKNAELSHLGKKVYCLMGLATLPESDKEKTIKKISTINNLVLMEQS